jgi:hypothetical protein
VPMARGTTNAAPGQRPRDDKRTGARAVGGKREKKRGGLLWLLLGLLALLLIALLLWLLIGGDDDKSDKGGGAAASALTVGGKSVLPPPPSGLADLDGRKATGTALKVVTVNGNEGFSVAKGDTSPVYVEWGGDVGRDEKSQFQPKKGQKVDLTGPVQAAGAAEVERLKLPATEARRVRAQGAFVNADKVVASK